MGQLFICIYKYYPYQQADILLIVLLSMKKTVGQLDNSQQINIPLYSHL